MIAEIIKRKTDAQKHINVGDKFDVIKREKRDGIVFVKGKTYEGKYVQINSSRFDFIFADGSLEDHRIIENLIKVRDRIKNVQEIEGKMRERKIEEICERIKKEPELKQLDLMIRLTEVMVVHKSEELCDKMAKARASEWKKEARAMREDCRAMRARWRQCKFDEGSYAKFVKACAEFEGMMSVNLVKMWFSLNSWVKNIHDKYNEIRTDALIISMIYSESRSLYFDFCKKLDMKATEPDANYYGLFRSLNKIAECCLKDYKNIEPFLSVLHNEFLKTKFMYEDELQAG